jgi:acetyl-CoA acetyltransferase
MLEIRDAGVIVGVGMTDISRNSGRTTLQLAVEAAAAALDDAGLSAQEVDGVVTYQVNDSSGALAIAAALGVPLVNWYGELFMGGPGATFGVSEACLALAAGLANTVVIVRAMNGRSGTRMGRYGAGAGADDYRQWTLPFGYTGPPQIYALWAQRHMAQYGTTSEQLGAVAVTMREHAQLNPGAFFHGQPITLEDHQASRMISSPFRLLDCCLESDAAAAIVVTTADRGRDTRRSPVYVSGFANGAGPSPWHPSFDWPDYGKMYSAYMSEPAFRMADLSPEDVDVALIYDAFTFGVIAALEDMGFVTKGDGGPFVEDGNIKLAGALPVNPNGGLLSEGYVHGLNNLIEGVRQLRGDAGQRQVPDAQVAVVTAGEGPRGGVLVLHG